MQETYLNLLYQCLRIRMVEEKIIKIYPTDIIQSPVHLSIGQEAVAVGICNNLTHEDMLYTSYRCHAYYLAKGGNINQMFAELYGKDTGCGRGKAGSMHLASKEVGFMGSSAVVGATISHAVGSALASKLLKKNQVCVAVFGDGATEEGSYHESLNFAAVFKLPVIFICENNGLAIHSKVEQRHSYNIANHAKSYGIKSLYVEEGYDFMALNTLMEQVVKDVRNNPQPYLIEVKTYRYMEHVGIGDDHHVEYRSLTDFETWKTNDPLMTDEENVINISLTIHDEIIAAVEFAEKSAFPSPSELFTDVY